MSEVSDAKLAEFQPGDLVWAKLKGFAPWPGKVVNPPLNMSRPKKGIHFCVFFFGSNNYAFIENTNIKPYLEFKEKLSGACKTSAFKDAIVQIEKYIENKEKFGEDFDAIDAEVELENSLSIDRVSLTPKEKPKKPKDSSAKKRSSDVIGKPPKKNKVSLAGDSDSSLIFSSPVKSSGRSGLHHILDRQSIINRPETPPLDVKSINSSILEKKVEPSNLVFGFIGLGSIGSCLAKNLANSGHKIVAWNRTQEKVTQLESIGVQSMQTPTDVVQTADITFCCVSDPVAAKSIVFGNCGVLKADLKDKGYVEMSGIDNEASLDISEAITNAGGRYLEAQLIGTRQQAETGTMLILTAGDDKIFKDCHSCFRVIGRHSYHLKEVGNACKMSLIFNLISGIAIAGLAEGLALADRSGLNSGDVLQIFTHTRLACPELIDKCERIIKDPHTKQFPLKHMQKYLKLALGLSDPMEQSLPITATTNEVFKHTMRLGYADCDVASVQNFYGDITKSSLTDITSILEEYTDDNYTKNEITIGFNDQEVNSKTMNGDIDEDSQTSKTNENHVGKDKSSKIDSNVKEANSDDASESNAITNSA